MEEEIRNLTEEIVESKRKVLKARFSILKSLPKAISSEQIVMDKEIDEHIKDVLELNFHNGFATLGVLEIDDFKVISADLENKKFKFEYKGKLYSSLRLLHMLTSTNKEIKENEEDIMQMIEDYYVIAQNIPFEFDNNGNITRNETLEASVNKWINRAEFKCEKMTYKEEHILETLDKYADEAIKALVGSIEITALNEMNYLLGE